MPGKFCNSCPSWEGGIFTRAGQSFGICHHPVASTMMVVDGSTRITEDPVAYTERNFGCVYCQQSSNILINNFKQQQAS
jgi:hypothetical protein